MPLIGEVGKYMAGSGTITALYAGSVKMWPLGPPAADYRATWRLDSNGLLRLIIDGGSGLPPANTTFTVAVDPFTGDVSAHSSFVLGTSGVGAAAQIFWHNPSYGDLVMALTDHAWGSGRVTNTVAARDWPGHILRITTGNSGRVELVEVVGSTTTQTGGPTTQTGGPTTQTGGTAPHADYQATWTQGTDGLIRLTIQDSPTSFMNAPPTSGTATVYVPPWTEGTILFPQHRLGSLSDTGLAQATWRANSGSTTTMYLGGTAFNNGPVTNYAAVTYFSGHVLRLTFAVNYNVPLIEVVDGATTGTGGPTTQTGGTAPQALSATWDGRNSKLMVAGPQLGAGTYKVDVALWDSQEAAGVLTGKVGWTGSAPTTNIGSITTSDGAVAVQTRPSFKQMVAYLQGARVDLTINRMLEADFVVTGVNPNVPAWKAVPLMTAPEAWLPFDTTQLDMSGHGHPMATRSYAKSTDLFPWGAAGHDCHGGKWLKLSISQDIPTFTVSAWYIPKAVASANDTSVVFGSFPYAAAPSGSFFVCQNYGGMASFGTATPGARVQTTGGAYGLRPTPTWPVFTVGKPVHLVWRSDGYMWVDGEKRECKTGSPSGSMIPTKITAVAGLTIGAAKESNGSMYASGDGAIGSFAYWKRNLADDEITSIYEAGTGAAPGTSSTGLPAADGTAHWEQPYELKLVVDGINGYTPGRYVIEVALPPTPIVHPSFTLGMTGTSPAARMWWGSGTSTATTISLTPPRAMTASEAAAEWGGHLVAFTITNSRIVTAVEVLDSALAGATGATGAAEVVMDDPNAFHAQDDQQHRIMIWDHYWADIAVYPNSSPVAVTLSPVWRQASVPAVETHWIDAASAAQAVINFATGANLTERDLVAMVARTGGVYMYNRYGMFFVRETP